MMTWMDLFPKKEKKEKRSGRFLKIKKWFGKNFGKLRVFKRIREAEETIKNYAYNIDQFRKENYDLKGQLMNRRKTIKALQEELLKVVNDLNLLGSEYDKLEEKKERAGKHIRQLVLRRDEFLKRLKASGFEGINSLADYKYFLSEPFIKDTYDNFVVKIHKDKPSELPKLDKIFGEKDDSGLPDAAS